MDEFEYCESNSDGISFFSDFPMDAHADSTDGDLDVHFHEMFTNNDSILKPAPKRVRPRLDGVFTPSEDEDSPTTLQQPLIFNTRENWNSLPSSSNALYVNSHVAECDSESFSPALVTSFFESRCPSECSPEPMPSPNSLSITPPVSPLPLRADAHAMDASFACSCDSKFPRWENLLSIQVRTSAKDLLSALFLDNGLLRKIHHFWGASDPFFGDWTAADKNVTVRQLNYVYPLFDDAVSLPCIEDQLLIIREDNHSQVVSKITCPRIIAACIETSFCITQSPLDSLESILRVHAPSCPGNEMQIFQSDRVHFLEILRQELESLSKRIDDNTYENENKITEVCLKPVSRVTEPKILENSVVGPKQKLAVLLAEIEGFEPKEKGEADCASRMTMTSQLGSRSVLSPKKLQAEKTGCPVSTELQAANFPSMASSPNGNVSTKARRSRKDLPKRVEIRLKMPGHWVRGNSPKPIEEYLAELPVRQLWLNDLKYNSFVGNSVLALAFQLVVVSIAVSGATPLQLMGVMYKLWLAGGVICQFVARAGSASIANAAKKSGEFFAMRMGFVRKASEQVLASDVDLTATASKILHAAPAAAVQVMPNNPTKEIGQVAGLLTGKNDAESTHAMTLLELFTVIYKIIF
ncbi:hypothetical protein HDU77_011797 [Chytriomyces hyalinus]|nr:hypothetical protein HDU77_011797 [Chytriomyces hyalinus]